MIHSNAFYELRVSRHCTISTVGSRIYPVIGNRRRNPGIRGQTGYLKASVTVIELMSKLTVEFGTVSSMPALLNIDDYFYSNLVDGVRMARGFQ